MFIIPFRLKYHYHKYSRLATIVDMIVNNILCAGIIALLAPMFLFLPVSLLFGVYVSDIPDGLFSAIMILFGIAAIACRILGPKYKWPEKVHMRVIKRRLEKDTAFARRFYTENPEAVAYIRSIRPDFVP